LQVQTKEIHFLVLQVDKAKRWTPSQKEKREQETKGLGQGNNEV
jgi:hypothetical protein